MSIDENSQTVWVRVAVERFSGSLLRYAQMLTGDLDEARDIVQDTFIRLCAQKPGRIEAHLAQWLFRVCRNRALDIQRKQRRMRPLNETEMSSQASPEPSPATQAERRDTSGEISALLAKLPKNQEEVVRLKFQEGLSYREISEITELSVSNVGFLIHTALKAVRQQMKVEPKRRIP